MKNLNLDETQFKDYKTDFAQLTYEQLCTTKTEIEAQLSLLFDLLSTQYHADMATSLLTDDGYPRSDIDVVGIRLVRVKIIRLRNDVKIVYSLLEAKMVEQFEAQRASGGAQAEQTAQVPDLPKPAPVYSIPFASVAEVVPHGPAFSSGLREGDRIVSFDDVHAANHNRLAGISARVRSSVDSPIAVHILRGLRRQVLLLTPTSNWDGNGLLGCRLLPL